MLCLQHDCVIESSAGELLRYRRAIDTDKVLVFADIEKKHGAHAITGDVSIAETEWYSDTLSGLPRPDRRDEGGDTDSQRHSP